jgi:uncharacterized protein YggE
MQESKCFCKRHIHIAILSAILLVALGLGGFFVYKYNTSRTITVIGTAQSQVSNQIASFTVSVDIQNKDKQAAVDQATAKANEIVVALTSFGIPDKDILPRI